MNGMSSSNDISEKITELLSDEESRRQLTELAQMLMSGTDSPETEGGREDIPSPAPDSGGDMPDIGTIMKLAELAGAVNASDSNTQFLLALRPHLSAERQKRVDKAIKLLRLASVWSIAKESGLLGNIFGEG